MPGKGHADRVPFYCLEKVTLTGSCSLGWKRSHCVPFYCLEMVTLTRSRSLACQSTDLQVDVSRGLHDIYYYPVSWVMDLVSEVSFREGFLPSLQKSWGGRKAWHWVTVTHPYGDHARSVVPSLAFECQCSHFELPPPTHPPLPALSLIHFSV